MVFSGQNAEIIQTIPSESTVHVNFGSRWRLQCISVDFPWLTNDVPFVVDWTSTLSRCLSRCVL